MPSILRSGPLLLLATLARSAVKASTTFDWEKLDASPELRWEPCDDSFQCTLLQVPLDYTSPEVGNASIAIVRLPANSSQADYLDPLLFNPGGPGGSGVDAVVQQGQDLASVFGPQFDIAGFDPRGCAHRRQLLRAQDIVLQITDAERRFLIPNTFNVIYPALDASPNGVGDALAQTRLYGKLAVAQDTDNVLQYMTTDNIAHDMLRITEAFGFEKLRYWGISYGSVLGATLYSQCDKIARIIIDGVEDMDGYHTSNSTFTLPETDAALQAFFDGGAAAGPTGCSFCAAVSSEARNVTAADLCNTLDALTAAVRQQPRADLCNTLDVLTAAVHQQPRAVFTPAAHGLVDCGVLRHATFDTLFAPYEGGFVGLAEGLAALAAGNATTFFEQTAAPTFECNCTQPPAPLHLNNFESYMTIACGDSIPVNDTLEQLQDYFAATSKLSTFADLLASTRVVCAGWTIQRADTFHVPVGARNASFPLLLVENTVDPVTQLPGAIKTSFAFPGSVVLTQDSVGHTSLVAPSACTNGYFRAYMVNGTLPEPGTVCPVDVTLFPG